MAPAASLLDRRTLLGAVVLASVTQAVPAVAAPTDEAADRASLDRLRVQTERAENAGDAAFFDGVSSPDIVLMPPGAPAVIGRSAVVASMRQMFQEFELQIRYQNEEIRVYDSVALDRGTYSQTLTPKRGGDSMSETGKYLWVYARDADETWRFSHVIWNAG
jgi:uncharacterized protein (TIGR02246 family)